LDVAVIIKFSRRLYGIDKCGGEVFLYFAAIDDEEMYSFGFSGDKFFLCSWSTSAGEINDPN